MSPASSLPATLYKLAELFWRDATEVDATGELPKAHLSALAEAGLYGIFAPASAGGLGLRYEDAGLVVEELASACLATTFVWIQHFTMLRALLDEQTPSALRNRLLRGVIRGEIRAGVVLAGLLPGPPRLRATLTSYGWLLDGEAPWVTGWGHVDLLVVTARSPADGMVVSFVVDAREQPGLTVAPMRLAAVNASATVRLGFAGLPVPDDRYIGQYRYDPVRYQHEGLRLNGSLALGVARRCCALIGPSALDDELRACRAELDGADSAHMPAARARASEFAVRAVHALAVWQGSSSALAGQHAERLAREAAFLLVFGSRPTIKGELLRRLGAGDLGSTIGGGGHDMKLKLDLHDIYNRGGEIDRALRDIIDEAVRKKAPLIEIIPGKGSGALKKHVLKFLDQKEIKALYHRVEKDSKNFGRIFVHFRW